MAISRDLKRYCPAEVKTEMKTENKQQMPRVIIFHIPQTSLLSLAPALTGYECQCHSNPPRRSPLRGQLHFYFGDFHSMENPAK